MLEHVVLISEVLLEPFYKRHVSAQLGSVTTYRVVDSKFGAEGEERKSQIFHKYIVDSLRVFAKPCLVNGKQPLSKQFVDLPNFDAPYFEFQDSSVQRFFAVF